MRSGELLEDLRDLRGRISDLVTLVEDHVVPFKGKQEVRVPEDT